MKAHKNKLYHLGIKQNVNQSTISFANEQRDWRILADLREYLIKQVKPPYANSPIQNIGNDIFVHNSTTISSSIKLFSWAKGKYSRGAVKFHTLLDLRESIPAFIFITDSKHHDSNILDIMIPISEAIYLMDKHMLICRFIQCISPESVRKTIFKLKKKISSDKHNDFYEFVHQQIFQD